MTHTLLKITWTFLVIFAIGIGLLPFLYLISDMSDGLLSTKPSEVLESLPWKTAFYVHIIGGGIGLCVGWSQFSTALRRTYLRLHRFIGKTYVVACLLGGLAAIALAPFATGGIISSLGFGTLALLWLITTTKAYVAARNAQYTAHRKWMIRSYALTFAAVTLRIWLPFSQIVAHMDFLPAYQIISWLCWIPNLLIAEWLIRGLRHQPAVTHL